MALRTLVTLSSLLGADVEAAAAGSSGWAPASAASVGNKQHRTGTEGFRVYGVLRKGQKQQRGS